MEETKDLRRELLLEMMSQCLDIPTQYIERMSIADVYHAAAKHRKSTKWIVLIRSFSDCSLGTAKCVFELTPRWASHVQFALDYNDPMAAAAELKMCVDKRDPGIEKKVTAFLQLAFYPGQKPMVKLPDIENIIKRADICFTIDNRFPRIEDE